MKSSFNYSLHCPDVLNGGKLSCSGEDCECEKDGETACIFGVCVCFHQMHLAFDSISCRDDNHAQILKNVTHDELNCPRTCFAYSPNNQCLHPSNKGKDGRCYCADSSLAVPKFTNDHKLAPHCVCPDLQTIERDNSTIHLQSNTVQHFNATQREYSVNDIFLCQFSIM